MSIAFASLLDAFVVPMRIIFTNETISDLLVSLYQRYWHSSHNCGIDCIEPTSAFCMA